MNPVPPSASCAPLRVWDLPTRLFHWLLVAAALALFVTGSLGGLWLEWHFRAGYCALALLLFRLVWGVVGGRWSRFVSFVYSPAHTWRYVRGNCAPHDEVGHSPTGALSVFALLALLVAQGTTGLFASDDIAFAGPLSHLVSDETVGLMSSLHKWGKPVLLALVALHVGAIVFYRIKGRNLIAPMLTGNKELAPDTPASADTLARRLWALAIVAMCAALVWWLSTLGADAMPSYM